MVNIPGTKWTIIQYCTRDQRYPDYCVGIFDTFEAAKAWAEEWLPDVKHEIARLVP
jgi:hypothetical protein